MVMKIDIEKVMSVASKYMSSFDYSDFRNEISEMFEPTYKKGRKVKLNDNLEFGKQTDRSKYNNQLVTIDSVVFDNYGNVDVFFIEEDGGYFEWSPDSVSMIEKHGRLHLKP
jgi:hypothetical protein